jgi:hypothetical protein
LLKIIAKGHRYHMRFPFLADSCQPPQMLALEICSFFWSKNVMTLTKPPHKIFCEAP